MKHLLVVEDGNEYEEFATLFLKDCFEIHGVHSAGEALDLLGTLEIDCVLMDLRFDRSSPEDLAGDLEATAARLFAGDLAAALSYLKEHQGTLILELIRARGYDLPVLFVHDFAPKRLENLQRLYGSIKAVPSFDAAAIKGALGCET